MLALFIAQKPQLLLDVGPVGHLEHVLVSARGLDLGSDRYPEDLNRTKFVVNHWFILAS